MNTLPLLRVAALTASAALSIATTSTAFADVRVHGATTVTFGLIKPHKEDIEKKAGTILSVLPSSTSRGLTDLAQGKADIAMLAEPLDTAAASLNQKQPGAVNESDFVGKHVGNAYVEFIINPANPTRKLSKDQLAGIFSGKIKNWSEVGGNPQPIMLVGEPSSSPHKLIANALAITYATEMRVVQNTNQTATIVMQVPGAISYLSTAHDLPERGKLKVVESEVKLPMQLFLAFRKDATEEVKKVVDAAASFGK